MSNDAYRPGIGAILFYMKGGSRIDKQELVGRTVTEAELVNEGQYYDYLRLELDGKDNIYIWDDGQSCCESRYMKCDDDVSSIVGGEIVHFEAKEGPDIEDGESHEQVFIEIQTTKGLITLNNHNEHNGYYGGFGLTITSYSPN